MVELRKIRNDLLKGLEGSQVSFICVRILDYAESQRSENLRMLTYSSLAKAARTDPGDPYFALAIHRLLRGGRKALFVKHYLLKDYDGEARKIDDDVVREAYTSREIVLSDGSVVHDVEEHLIPYFSASNMLLEAKASPKWK
ncbi:hypothetical protein [Stenotrophomonas maltophilia]|uniref:hypothetical protein n=1 Tax=Stenotrophomonas maltophilia TaxID=40324 RepID=UPI0012F7F48A|nr:hypothetical protein [Stenotrophomonas maltophilia]